MRSLLTAALGFTYLAWLTYAALLLCGLYLSRDALEHMLPLRQLVLMVAPVPLSIITAGLMLWRRKFSL